MLKRSAGFPALIFPEQYETYWGNPATTKEMIDEIKKTGFSTLRIPVTWYEYMKRSLHLVGRFRL